MSRIHQRVRDDSRTPGSTRPVFAAAREPGNSLGQPARAFMEGRFHHDFGDVRVHDGADAREAVEDVGGDAFALGDDIYVGERLAEAPGLPALHLLAHELAHVVQHDRGAPRDARVSSESDVAEGEARHAADAMLAGDSVTVGPTPGAAVATGFLSDASMFLGLPKKVFGAAPWLSPVTSTLGAMGGVDKAMNADDGLGVASGLMGAGSGILGLTSWMGEDWMKGTPMGNAVGGIGGLLGAGGSTLDAISDFSKGEYGKGALDTTKAVGGTLSGLGSLGGFSLSSVGEMGALEALAGGGGEGLAALGPAGAVIGAGLAGAGLGTYLYNDTTVGEHGQETLGGLDAWLTDEGERPWSLRTSEAMEENWDKGNYLSAIGEGAELAGFATLGALGGIGGGIVDAASSIGGGIADAAGWVGDKLNPFNW